MTACMRRRSDSRSRLATSRVLVLPRCSAQHCASHVHEAAVTFLLPSRWWHPPLEPDVVIRHCPATRSRRGHRAGPVKLSVPPSRIVALCRAHCFLLAQSVRGPCAGPTGPGLIADEPPWSVLGPHLVALCPVSEILLIAACCCPVDFSLVHEGLLSCNFMTKSS